MSRRTRITLLFLLRAKRPLALSDTSAMDEVEG
jgi:hypothetical protein